MNNISLKEKFCILYSHTLLLLRYRFFTAWDKHIAGFNFLGTHIIFWYWFIMTCISLTAPPNCTPYLLSCFPMSKHGPRMSLRGEHRFVVVKLESCVWLCLHKLISPETSPYWYMWCKEKGNKGRAACKKRWNLPGHTMEKGPWWRSLHLPCYGRTAERGVAKVGTDQTILMRVRCGGAKLWIHGL